MFFWQNKEFQNSPEWAEQAEMMRQWVWSNPHRVQRNLCWLLGAWHRNRVSNLAAQAIGLAAAYPRRKENVSEGACAGLLEVLYAGLRGQAFRAFYMAAWALAESVDESLAEVEMPEWPAGLIDAVTASLSTEAAA